MAKREITTKECGIFKTKISNALLQSDNIRELVLDDSSGTITASTLTNFKEHVKSHLFIDETITDVSTYIYYDVIVPNTGTQTKDLRMYIYCICSRDILENYQKEGYYGNRTDILSQMVEEILLDYDLIKTFGIGDLTLTDVDIYNSTTFYGRIMQFVVPNFR